MFFVKLLSAFPVFSRLVFIVDSVHLIFMFSTFMFAVNTAQMDYHHLLPILVDRKNNFQIIFTQTNSIKNCKIIFNLAQFQLPGNKQIGNRIRIFQKIKVDIILPYQVTYKRMENKNGKNQFSFSNLNIFIYNVTNGLIN